VGAKIPRGASYPLCSSSTPDLNIDCINVATSIQTGKVRTPIILPSNGSRLDMRLCLACNLMASNHSSSFWGPRLQLQLRECDALHIWISGGKREWRLFSLSYSLIELLFSCALPQDCVLSHLPATPSPVQNAFVELLSSCGLWDMQLLGVERSCSNNTCDNFSRSDYCRPRFRLP
jgi:hypothetical protein